MSKFITDGKQVYKVLDKQPHEYAGLIWFVINEQGKEIGLTNVQYNGMLPVDQEDVPFDAREKFGLIVHQPESPKPEQRESDFILYTASGIDPLTTALILADEGVPTAQPTPSTNGISEQVARTCARFLVGLGVLAGTIVFVRVFYFVYLN